eukprot:2754412-Pyramimonas_sp.AAC.1
MDCAAHAAPRRQRWRPSCATARAAAPPDRPRSNVPSYRATNQGARPRNDCATSLSDAMRQAWPPDEQRRRCAAAEAEHRRPF